MRQLTQARRAVNWYLIGLDFNDRYSAGYKRTFSIFAGCNAFDHTGRRTAEVSFSGCDASSMAIFSKGLVRLQALKLG